MVMTKDFTALYYNHSEQICNFARYYLIYKTLTSDKLFIMNTFLRGKETDFAVSLEANKSIQWYYTYYTVNYNTITLHYNFALQFMVSCWSTENMIACYFVTPHS